MSLRLSSAQQEVVNHTNGALLVVAGPGSGKTRVLTERVRRLLEQPAQHFRVLALTFTNKAANEMRERLNDLQDLKKRAFIGTLHGFCLEMLAERGKPIGIETLPQIFESIADRKQVLREAVSADPVLLSELEAEEDEKARNKKLDDWLRGISYAKTHPLSYDEDADPIGERVKDAFDAGLRASGAYDFDDLLLLAYKLLSEYPQIASFYRRLYGYICIDEAQDLNEVQYAVITALCGKEFKNVMMVGDPRQSIYGFSTASPRFMLSFETDFSARKIELRENFRSSQAVVNVARSIQPDYAVDQQLPIQGEASLLVGADEQGEASLVVEQLLSLVAVGHPDVEGKLSFKNCAVLARTRYALLEVERELNQRGIEFFRRMSSIQEYESVEMKEFLLGLRVVANPQDRMHLAELCKKWHLPYSSVYSPRSSEEVLQTLRSLSQRAETKSAEIVVSSLSAVWSNTDRLDVMRALELLRAHADQRSQEEKRALYEDIAVIEQEWDNYIRDGARPCTVAGFLNSLALGTTKSHHKDGVALLTVHSSKGLEFDVVFIVGMCDGVFPDFRAKGSSTAMAEERRSAFVAVTRSRRLLFLCYPKTRRMPWGDVWAQSASQYIPKTLLARN